MLAGYFRNLYQRSMTRAYGLARSEIAGAIANGGNVLDCGALDGREFDLLHREPGLEAKNYRGIEWNADAVERARAKGIEVVHGDLNQLMPFATGSFNCIFGLSVLEHLLNPCRYLNECYRCLQPGGTLVLLTPNISTFFTIALLLVGKMPSSGPHPDSDRLLKKEELFKVSHDSIEPDVENDTPVHRHLVVFSYRVLRSYLRMIGFNDVRGHGFGLYPFPNFLQGALERIDPYHCHQMVFIARK